MPEPDADPIVPMIILLDESGPRFGDDDR